MALGLWLACTLPFLDRSRLQDSDELTHACVAKSAAVDGHWWPLTYQGRVFYEKPPLQLWLAAAAAQASGQPRAAWPYRIWNGLGAGLALASLVALGALLGRPAAGWAAAGLLALQGDWLFHARFFTFDTPFVGLALAALAAGLWATQGPARRWWLSGALLALAVWIKSWFVLALGPAWAWGLWAALPAGRRGAAAWRLALPVAAALLLWLALYVDWNGWGFLAEEWNQNLMGRALGRSNVNDPDGVLAYYLKWSQRSCPALLPLALAVPLGLWPGPAGADADARPASPLRLASGFTWALCASWLLGLCVQRAQTINYLLPLEAALALGLGLAVDAAVDRGTDAALALLLLACAASSRRWWPPQLSLALGLPLGALWLWSRGRGAPRHSRWAWLALAGLL
ncbi:MAG TPA: hypothetical protein VK842_07195, partial [bacterium]|nr:hypothetical protein [bacterium]